MERTDEELVTAHLAGDEEAFSRLVKHNLKSIYSFAARSAPNDAEDIVQDVFLKAWKNLKSFNPDTAKFKTWLMRIARNTVIDHLRKKTPHIFSELERAEGEDRFANEPDTSPLPDEVVARAHDARALEAALAELAPPSREVLLLRYMNQLSFEEIAEVLNKPANTVRSRHRRALTHLRTHLEALHQKTL